MLRTKAPAHHETALRSPSFRSLQPERRPYASPPLAQRQSEAAQADEALGHSSAQSLDTSTRHDMESRFHFDFSRIRILADTSAAASARALGARAYTMRNRIAF